MTNAEILAKVKTGLMITGSNFDDVLTLHIESVKSFMEFAGVKKSVVDDAVSVGCILTGVSDLWNNAGGEGKFSEFFCWRVAQLCCEELKPAPDMTYSVCVPTLEQASLFGWLETSLSQLTKNLNECELAVSDNEIIRVTLKKPDGSVFVGENDKTGNRRNTSVGGVNVGVFPKTVYDIEQTKFVNSTDATAIVVPGTLSGSVITFETFDKGAE